MQVSLIKKPLRLIETVIVTEVIPMKPSLLNQKKSVLLSGKNSKSKEYINDAIQSCWEKVAPFWPLKNLIATNPFQGFLDYSFCEAIKLSKTYYEKKDSQCFFENLNRENLKWLQLYFDQGQAKILMPDKDKGLYSSWKNLIRYDTNLHGNEKKKIQWIEGLPNDHQEAIKYCFSSLGLEPRHYGECLLSLLSTLSGWASYIKYLSDWANSPEQEKFRTIKTEYLLVRLGLCCLLDLKSEVLLGWQQGDEVDDVGEEKKFLETLKHTEDLYRKQLLRKLINSKPRVSSHPEAQLVFCIDVRSEPLRRSIEKQGNYETFGYAGFFGLPIQIKNKALDQSEDLCPVLIQPKHSVHESYSFKRQDRSAKKEHRKNIYTVFRSLYDSLKYNFSTPFTFVEILGWTGSFFMGIRNFMPCKTEKIKNHLKDKKKSIFSIDSIPFKEQCEYALSLLRMMGMKNFAPLVVLCGHGSTTKNNPFSSSLDCGACGGHKGGKNAQILAEILNKPSIRSYLKEQSVPIPDTTLFIGAEHNTTTDEVKIYNTEEEKPWLDKIKALKNDLLRAGESNAGKRMKTFSPLVKAQSAQQQVANRSQDWSQVRPEWGLANNAAFIVAPRKFTQNVELEGRVFLHSYDWQEDKEGAFLENILTAPVIVAHWINMQYFFSTYNNVSYGAGSKVTNNVVGKFAVMQGNVSDLMNGLSLQSVYKNDDEPFHELQRLFTIVYAPRKTIYSIVEGHDMLRKLVKNEWMALACIDPDTQQSHIMDKNFKWKRYL